MDEPAKLQPFPYTDSQHMAEKLQPPRDMVGRTNVASFGTQTQTSPAWFDVKVFYVRMNSCYFQEAPQTLLIEYPERDTKTALEINGVRFSASERACFLLRRDRMDTGFAEATYVNTNNLRTSGKLMFEIYARDELLVQGMLARSDSKDFYHRAGEDSGPNITSAFTIEARWTMSCCFSPFLNRSCSSLTGKSRTSLATAPLMEVYVAGRSSSLPIVLTQATPLVTEKRCLLFCSLEPIPEEAELAYVETGSAKAAADEEAYSKFDVGGSWALGVPNGLLFSNFEGNGEGDDEELSWFNAGVRVGVGLGLGMCLGVGIGVGLFMRAYQATMGPVKRRMFWG